MAEEVADTDRFRSARFTNVDLSGAVFRDVDLTGARFLDGVLIGVELSGMIEGLRVNDVEVAPLVEAELDRRHPERLALRATTAPGMREGWAVVGAMWEPTFELARRLPEHARHEQADGDWSLVETLRHLIFVTDSWFGRAVLGEAHPYHPIGLAPSFLTGVPLGLDPAAQPSFDEVLDIRQGRFDAVAAYLATATDDDLSRAGPASGEVGYPPGSQRTALACLHVVMDEEWAHHKYAMRDLAKLGAAGAAQAPPDEGGR